MHWLMDPSHAAMVLGWVALVMSEIMPFLPSKANGIVHAILSLIVAAKAQLPASSAPDASKPEVK